MACILQWIESHQALAGWAQAVASVAAIWWAGRTGTRLQRSDRLHARKTLAGAVLEIATAAQQRLGHAASEIKDREALYLIGVGDKHFDQHGLGEIEKAVTAIPLHELNTPELVRLVLMLSGTVRQFRENVEAAIRLYSSMDAAQHDAFFTGLREMCDGCEDIKKRISAQLAAIK
ncbi:hypothetical protein [Cupriavidus necator]|uniref:hypothetical protein n=1 Tax=Cupriavidus necator TaxID=106590 RepID=UPI00068BF55E|nr:hypothetical protein [Cupriavidus necator]